VVQRPVLGSGYQITGNMLQDDTGAAVQVPIQITSLEDREDGYVIDAQESIFVEQDDLGETKLIFIDDIVFNVNLRNLFDKTYLPPVSGDVVRVIVGSRAIVASKSVTTPSMTVGSWPEGVDLTLVVNAGGEIIGRGGDGGSVPIMFGTVQPGGTAFKTRRPITIINNGKIRGGGGGGGRGDAINVSETEGGGPHFKGAGGGGGAGHLPGVGGFAAENGTYEQGGEGGVYHGPVNTSIGGDGGKPGEAGASGNGAAGGAAGTAIDGESFVTYDPEGTIKGGRIN
jgi:hypothetical protein